MVIFPPLFIIYYWRSDSLLLGTPRYCSCGVGSCHKNIDSVDVDVNATEIFSFAFLVSKLGC
jgi:hypothetical protein